MLRIDFRAGRQYMMNKAKVVIIEDEPDIIEVMSYKWCGWLESGA